MTPLTPAIISESAEQLDCGFRIFVHKTTGNIVFFPNELDMMDADPELWQEEIDLVENNVSDYLEVEKWTSGDAFRAMHEFAEKCVDDKSLKRKLLDALEQRKPFKSFRAIIDHSGSTRQEWFDFKNKWQVDYVRRWVVNAAEIEE